METKAQISFTQYVSNYHMTDLVDVMAWYNVVERTVEIIQQLDYLHRTTFWRDLSEPDDIREVDSRARIHLWRHTTSNFQFIRYITIKQRTAKNSKNQAMILRSVLASDGGMSIITFRIFRFFFLHVSQLRLSYQEVYKLIILSSVLLTWCIVNYENDGNCKDLRWQHPVQ